MKTNDIILTIKEKQKEYKHGSDAYNVLRNLEVTLPNIITQHTKSHLEAVRDEIQTIIDKYKPSWQDDDDENNFKECIELINEQIKSLK